MRRLRRVVGLAACAVGVLVFPAAASADHADRVDLRLEALGHSPNPASFLPEGDPPGPAPAEINSDLAFWGNLAFNGNYDGFRIIDIADPQNPQEISHTRCQGNQGDIIVWGNVLVRSWNSPAPEGATCDGEPVPQHFEGLHVFDISDPADPRLLGRLELPCGSHTLTAVPDPENGRLLVYNNPAGGVCLIFDIVEVPLADPGAMRLLRHIPVEADRSCHDTGVILGNVNLAACASGSATNVYDIGENRWEGGSLERPRLVYTVEEEGVGPKPAGEPHSGSWHSAAFSWDGEVLILGWEPGGGADPECEATDPAVTKSVFFYDADTGEKLGQWTLPRAQTAEENCTIHNYNVVPTLNGRYILVSGNYQAGTWVTEFTDPSDARTLAFSDPRPLVPTQLGGAWSSYWYNDLIYESDITTGLNVFRARGFAAAAMRPSEELHHLNPQTQEFSIDFGDRARLGDEQVQR